MKRKEFLIKSMSFAALIALHKQAQTIDFLRKKEKIPPVDKCRFPEITLYTSMLEEQLEFYSKTLGFPIIESTKTQFSVQLGDSVLRFKEATDGTSPFYHYAINIPSNKHVKAQKWLEEKTPLLGGGYFYFDFWDATAIYFKDPAGNIGELIARHTLDNDREGEFGVSDLLCVSEIGVPVDDPSELAQELKSAYNLGTLGGNMFIGDENGLFVAVPIGRNWFPEYNQEAKVYPTEIVISDNGKDNFQYKDYPYKITRKK